MLGYSCMQCTRIFTGDRPAGDRLPRHLDALLGCPCPGAGLPVLFYT